MKLLAEQISHGQAAFTPELGAAREHEVRTVQARSDLDRISCNLPKDTKFDW
jgi:hypothetical protein